jgi:hypothetical protein
VRAEAVSGVTVIPAGGLVLCFDTRRLDCVLMGEERCYLVAPLVGVPIPVHGKVYSLTGILLFRLWYIIDRNFL